MRLFLVSNSLNLRRFRRDRAVLFFLCASLSACLEPPPKIAAIPPQGMAIRVHLFGADAEHGRALFDGMKGNNPQLQFVTEGGDGEILIGLDRDNTRCVEPTAYCEYRVALRIRDAAETVLHAEFKPTGESSQTCSYICRKALMKTVVNAMEKAATLLKKTGGSTPDAAPIDDTASNESSDTKRTARSMKREPLFCSVAKGPRLPSQEAEKRIAQVDALKRQGILDEKEFECLRKAYLSRL